MAFLLGFHFLVLHVFLRSFWGFKLTTSNSSGTFSASALICHVCTCAHVCVKAVMHSNAVDFKVQEKKKQPQSTTFLKPKCLMVNTHYTPLNVVYMFVFSLKNIKSVGLNQDFIYLFL